MRTVYIASYSGGKDSQCMIPELIRRGWPLDAVIHFATGMDFDCIAVNVEKTRKLCEMNNIRFIVLTPDKPMEYTMCDEPIIKKNGTHQCGLKWCGYGGCRWMTDIKKRKIRNWIKTNYPEDKFRVIQYIGIARDEPKRIQKARVEREPYPAIYPLVEWGFTEDDCLKYCYDAGFDWLEDGVDLYGPSPDGKVEHILQRVSCFACGYKNLDEIRNMYHYLSRYFKKLKELQAKMMDYPFYAGSQTVFELEERFKLEDAQMTIDDWLKTGA